MECIHSLHKCFALSGDVCGTENACEDRALGIVVCFQLFVENHLCLEVPEILNTSLHTDLEFLFLCLSVLNLLAASE